VTKPVGDALLASMSQLPEDVHRWLNSSILTVSFTSSALSPMILTSIVGDESFSSIFTSPLPINAW
jgi:hypothetical protein